jgi:hypothetical protein
MYLAQGSVTHKLQQRAPSKTTLASLLRSPASASSALPPGGTTSSTSQLPPLTEPASGKSEEGSNDNGRDTTGAMPGAGGDAAEPTTTSAPHDGSTPAPSDSSSTELQATPADGATTADAPADFAAVVTMAEPVEQPPPASGSEVTDNNGTANNIATSQATLPAQGTATGRITGLANLPRIRTTGASRFSGTSAAGAKPAGIPLHLLVTAGVSSPTHVQGDGEVSGGGGLPSRSPSLALGRALTRTVSSLQNVSRAMVAVGRASFMRRPKPPGWHRRMATAGRRDEWWPLTA